MKIRKSWFNGDRLLIEQLSGLSKLSDYLCGSRILDLGCAEGHISRWCLENGAAYIKGIDIAPEFILEAIKYNDEWAHRSSFEVFDLNEIHKYTEFIDYDIVLALAILHKVKHPKNLIINLQKFNPELIVVRLPGNTKDVILDPRSNNIPVNVTYELRQKYKLMYEDTGHLNEWVGYYELR